MNERNWCRHCGTRDGELIVAGEYDSWVQDEDDIGYLYCLPCVDRLQREAQRWSLAYAEQSCEQSAEIIPFPSAEDRARRVGRRITST